MSLVHFIFGDFIGQSGHIPYRFYKHLFMFCSRPGPGDTVRCRRAPEEYEMGELSAGSLLSCGLGLGTGTIWGGTNEQCAYAVLPLV